MFETGFSQKTVYPADEVYFLKPVFRNNLNEDDEINPPVGYSVGSV